MEPSVRRGIARQEPRTEPRGRRPTADNPQLDPRPAERGVGSGGSRGPGGAHPCRHPPALSEADLACSPVSPPEPAPRDTRGHPPAALVTRDVRLCLLRTSRGMCSGTGSEGHWAGGEVRAGHLESRREG